MQPDELIKDPRGSTSMLDYLHHNNVYYWHNVFLISRLLSVNTVTPHQIKPVKAHGKSRMYRMRATLDNDRRWGNINRQPDNRQPDKVTRSFYFCICPYQVCTADCILQLVRRRHGASSTLDSLAVSPFLLQHKIMTSRGRHEKHLIEKWSAVSQWDWL